MIWSSNPTPGHRTEENHTQKDMCTPVFIAALFTIAKTWKQPKCPPTDEWIKKMCARTHTHTHEYYSAMKKNEIMPAAATWVVLEIIILSAVRKRNTYAVTSMWDRKHKWTYLRNSNRHKHKPVIAKGEESGGGKDWELGVSWCQLLYIGWMNNKVLLYSISCDKP